MFECRTCYASITLFCKRRDLNSSEVEFLEKELKDRKKQQLGLQAKIDKLIAANEISKRQFTDRVMAKIAEDQAQIASFKKKTMGIEEAHVRLTHLITRVSADDVAVPLFA